MRSSDFRETTLEVKHARGEFAFWLGCGNIRNVRVNINVNPDAPDFLLFFEAGLNMAVWFSEHEGALNYAESLRRGGWIIGFAKVSNDAEQFVIEAINNARRSKEKKPNW